MKFNRSYKISVQGNDGQEIIIESPLTISFGITRTIDSSVNNMNLQIKNLSLPIRNNLFQDRISFITHRPIRVEAGYNELSLIFSGSILESYSRRSGADIDTNIVAMDGGFDVYTSKTSATIAKNTSLKDVIKSLIGNMPNTQEGAIGDSEEVFKRPVVIEGNTFSLISKYSNDNAYIDQEKIYVLNGDEAIEGLLPLINSETGLLETPRRSGNYVEIDTIFEPRINIGQLLEVQSKVAPIFDGQYKVVGIKHSGIISGAVGGDLKSTFNLLVGSGLYDKFKVVK